MNTVLQLSVVTLALIVPVVQAGPILDQTLLALWLVSLATELGKSYILSVRDILLHDGDSLFSAWEQA